MKQNEVKIKPLQTLQYLKNKQNPLEPQAADVSKQQLIWSYVCADFRKEQSQEFYLLRCVVIFF